MKKIMFSVLVCVTFAFSGFASNEVVNEITQTNNPIQVYELLYIEGVDVFHKTEDCLLKITIFFKNGSSEVKYVLVTGASCEELLGPSKTKTITPVK